MKKKWISLFCILVLLGAIGLVFAEGSAIVYNLGAEKNSVVTSIGTKTLPIGTKIGGYPTNYITIEESTTLYTLEQGAKEFNQGTLIDCDFSPGEPDPC
ncbi:MAG: hypothetical protein KKG59_01525, partial [Nanoarchaeota archaeon]|nr:hypothetical protein [Nanoarchaeota archaeon]